MSLRWEDERYVRVYTRDTVDWLSLSWEARALFVLMLRKVDRAGILDVGRAGRRGVAVATGVPVEVAARAVDELLQDGCIEEHGSTFVVRNFIEAQEAPSSGAQRSRESRAKARDLARAKVLNPGEAATKRVATDTPCNAATHGDTPFCSDPCFKNSSPPPARVMESESGPEPECDTDRLRDAWVKATGALPDTRLIEVRGVCEDAARAQSPPVDATEYALRAVDAFIRWRQGITDERKRPALSTTKFLEHFERLQRIVAGLDPAVPRAPPSDRRGPGRPWEQTRPKPRDAADILAQLHKESA